MQIKRINFSEYVGKPNEWMLRDFSLGQINLIVGRNAVGKTRTINVLSGLASLLSENRKIRWDNGNYEVEFSNAESPVNYTLEFQNKSIIKEALKIGETTLLDRGEDGTGTIYFSEQEKSFRFQTPSNEIAAYRRRDAIQHPFLEKLYEWGNNLIVFRFGKTMGQETLILKDDKEAPDINVKDTEKAVGIFIAGKQKFGSNFTNQIINDLNEIGYYINNIDIDTPEGLTLQSNFPINLSTPLGIYVQEIDRKGVTHQPNMSQGMFRSLSTIIQINYFLKVNTTGTILIDDIGEGIDFERSSSLIQLLIKKISDSNFQLIMTTNDRYTMNKISIDYWSILERKGGLCVAYNYENSKEIFDEFKLMGLNNFDLFSSNFHLKNINGNNV